jgi:hypothetical protein
MLTEARAALAGIALICAGATVRAETPRDLLTHASFHDRDKAVAIKRVALAHAAAAAQLQRSPNDREAALMQATALGYRAKLTGSRGDAIAARKVMEQLVARVPSDPERQVVLGAWHMGAVHKLGRMVARAALGASKSAGIAALDRAVALGGGRAMFPALAGMLRLEMDPTDPRGRALVEAAARGATPTAIDRQLQRGAAAVLKPLRAGDKDATRKLASLMLPFGRIDGN